MKNKRSILRRIILGVLFMFCMTGAVTAQESDIREYRIDTLVGSFKATPIGVDQVRYIGTDYITHDDSTLMRQITIVVQKDLDFYADFELVMIDSFYLATYEIDELNLLGWERLGADYALKIETEFPAKNIRAFWRLYKTRTKREIASGKIEEKRSSWREIGHDISNAVVRVITGDPGIFRTKVAYIKRVGEAKEIFIADYNGANERQITHSGSTNISPVFSPSGKEIFFTSFISGDPQLHKVEIATGKITQITDYKGIAIAPAISPDSNKIALVLSKDGNSEIYVIDLNGKIIKRLTRHRSIDSAPCWSPDGRKLAFSSDRSGAPQIYIMDSDGLNVRRLTYQGSYNDSPIWSIRDRVIFVSRTKQGRFDLASINSDGSDFRRLTEVGRNENPHFAPDGKHIIFSSTRLSSGDIYTMDLSGRNQRRITRGSECSNPSWEPLR